MAKAIHRHIILIGMPGCGKSTLGAELGRRLGRPYIDTDQQIEQAAGARLQDLLDSRGPEAFAALEEQVGLRVDPDSPGIIATGGSMVYSDAAMEHLARVGLIVFIDVPLERLMQRVGSGHDRGLLNRTDGGLAEMYAERLPLYQRHADITVRLDGGTPADHVEQLLARLDHAPASPSIARGTSAAGSCR